MRCFGWYSGPLPDIVYLKGSGKVMEFKSNSVASSTLLGSYFLVRFKPRSAATKKETALGAILRHFPGSEILIPRTDLNVLRKNRDKLISVRSRKLVAKT